MDCALQADCYSPSSALKEEPSRTSEVLDPSVLDNAPVEVPDYLSSCMFACWEFLSTQCDKLRTSFVEGLENVKNSAVNLAEDAYHGVLSKDRIDGIAQEINRSLFSITSLPEINQKSQTKEAIFGRQKLVSILQKFTEVDRAHPKKIVNRVHAQQIIDVLLKREDATLSVEEWAYVSSMSDAMLEDWQALKTEKWKACAESGAEIQIETQSSFLRRLDFLTKGLKFVSLISRLDWAHLAQEEILDVMEQYYLPLWDPGYSESTTYGGYVGTSVGVSLGREVGLELFDLTAGINVHCAREFEFFLDDERCPGLLKFFNLGVSAEAKIKLPMAAQIALSTNGTLKSGVYRDWDGARDYATDQFTTLIYEKPHRNNPAIQRYLSRGATLANAEIVPGYSRLIATRDEVAEIGRLEKNYGLVKDDIEQYFSILLSSTVHDAKVLSIPRQLSLNESKEEEDARKKSYQNLPDDINTLRYASLEQEIDYIDKLRAIFDEQEIDNEKALQDPCDEQEIDYEKTVPDPSAEQRIYYEKLMKDAEVRKLLADFHDVASPKMPFQLDPIHLAHSGAVDAGVIDYAASVDIGAGGGFCNFLSAGVKGTYLRQHCVLPDVNRTPLCERLADPLKTREEKAVQNHIIIGQVATEFMRFNNQLLASWNEEAPMTDIDVSRQIKFLKQDFAFCKNLHARIAGSAKLEQDEKMLGVFVRRYGASNTEQFLHRMAIATAYYFSKTEDPQLKKDLLELEDAILHPDFDVDRGYLLKHAYFQEDLDYEIIDNRVSLAVNVATTFPIGINGSIEIAVRERERKFPNMLRDGYYLDVFISFKGDIGDITESINAASAEIGKQLSQEAANHVADQLKLAWQVVGTTSIYQGELVRQIRFYKPRDYAEHVPYRNIFSRWSTETASKYALDRVIPMGVANLTFGLGYEALTTNCRKEVYTGNTFFYLFMQGMREHYLGLINPDTGAIGDNSYWHTIRQEQKPAFSELFANIGRELTRHDTQPFLIEELERMRDSIVSKKISEEEQLAIDQAKEKAIKNAKDLELLSQKMLAMTDGILKGQRKSKEQLRNREAAVEMSRLIKEVRYISTEMEMLESCDAEMARSIEQKHNQLMAMCKKIISNAQSAKSAIKAQAEELIGLSIKIRNATRKSTQPDTTLLNELTVIGESIEKNVKLTPAEKSNFTTAREEFLTAMKNYETLTNSQERRSKLEAVVSELENLMPSITNLNEEKEKNLNEEEKIVKAKTDKAGVEKQTLANNLSEARKFFAEKNSESELEYCMRCFENLMHTFYPQWRERYYNSALLKARPLTPLEEVAA